MQHCCKFKPIDVYFLKETSLYVQRKLSIGFCPICEKPVAELVKQDFTGSITREYAIGIKANEMLYEYKEEILYSVSSLNYKRTKSKPFGWKYGVNKISKRKNKEVIKQYAYDFYGNKELIKTVK